ncbi:MAG: hypothetical protein HY709_05550 [Candidatus Latescibacteria bacterium]|nr:hypothetical protein [Candidatus Latescibacterota bacterium]
MKYIGYLLLFVLFFAGSSGSAEEPDVRLYLTNGDIVTGKLIDHAPDLIIVRARGDIHTYLPDQVVKIETLESLGDEARIVRVRTFPHIEWLGGTVALGSVAFLSLSSASDKQEEADQNKKVNLPPFSYSDLEDDAAKLRAIGWSMAALATGTTVFALIPRWVEKKAFPDISLRMDRDRTVYVAYTKRL